MRTILSEKIAARGHPICVGFDPDISELHPFLERQQHGSSIESFLVHWYQSVIEPTHKTAHSVKFQSAFFEQFGSAGMSVLRDLIRDAKKLGLFTILDAKRGDISSTMTAYGKMAFETYEADSLTILPWMGTDSLKALLPWMKKGKGVYIVWLSSNASGRALQMAASHSGDPFAKIAFDQFHELAMTHNVTRQIGWVLGATDIPLKFIQSLPPGGHSFLLPGIGAQGGRFDATSTALARENPASLFPVSRAILKPDDSDPLHSWTDYSAFVSRRWTDLIGAWQSSQT